MEKICNWGMYPRVDANVHSVRQPDEAVALVNRTARLIARGNGRCYGDSALQGEILSTLSLNKILGIDTQHGTIRCEAGVLLDDILKVIVPAGFFLPVTPGTKLITIGGAVAANVHGKNHHKEGAISRYIDSLRVLNAEGEIVECSRGSNPELFRNTIGAMGLTGVITEVTLRLKPVQSAFIRERSIKAGNLDEILELFEAHHESTYSVAWIDCLARGSRLGRSILMLGEHSSLEELSASQRKQRLKTHSDRQVPIPFMFPAATLNRLSVWTFNQLYYYRQFKREVNHTVHYDPYFYPLDALKNWNRLYGRPGFTQYQFVLPFENGREGLREILDRIAASGCASFLAVLKTFGQADSDSSPISFPMPGYTLALDFKVNQKVFDLLDELDERVMECGGRLYLAKDARMSSETFHRTYPDHATAPGTFGSDKFCSLQSERLKIQV